MARTTYKDKYGRYHSVIDNDEAEQVAGFYEDAKEMYGLNDTDVMVALQEYDQNRKFKK